MNAPSLQALSVISYKEKKATPVSIIWNSDAPIQQMTLTLLYGLQAQAQEETLQSQHQAWLSSWTDKVKSSIENSNVQQAIIQAMHKWYNVQKQFPTAPQRSLLQNPQVHITNFLDYASLCLKFISHHKNKSTAVQLLHLIMLHTNPGGHSDNIHKYYEIKNTLYHMQKQHASNQSHYKKNLLHDRDAYKNAAFVTVNSLLYMTMGFMIGSLSETISKVIIPCF
jgi:hypothetical protein